MNIDQGPMADIYKSKDTLPRKRLLNDFERVLHRVPIDVYLHVKPLNCVEIKEGESEDCLNIEDSQTVALHLPKMSFTFKNKSRNLVTAENMKALVLNLPF